MTQPVSWPLGVIYAQFKRNEELLLVSQRNPPKRISKKNKVTSFVNEMKQYLDRHSLNYAADNPFKNSSISPYTHFLNGAVEMSKNGTKWISRKKYGEDYFKKLYPIFCLDFNLDYKNY